MSAIVSRIPKWDSSCGAAAQSTACSRSRTSRGGVSTRWLWRRRRPGLLRWLDQKRPNRRPEYEGRTVTARSPWALAPSTRRAAPADQPAQDTDRGTAHSVAAGIGLTCAIRERAGPKYRETAHRRDLRGWRRSAGPADIVRRLNPIIRGWTAYHRPVVASEAFAKPGTPGRSSVPAVRHRRSRRIECGSSAAAVCGRLGRSRRRRRCS